MHEKNRITLTNWYYNFFSNFYCHCLSGTTKIKNLDGNIKAVDINLTEEDLKEVSDTVCIEEVAGSRTYEYLLSTSWRYANTPRTGWLLTQEHADQGAVTEYVCTFLVWHRGFKNNIPCGEHYSFNLGERCKNANIYLVRIWYRVSSLYVK